MRAARAAALPPDLGCELVASPSACAVARELGEIATIRGRPGVVVAAPHGSFDAATDEIGARVAATTGAGAVIASGFCAARTGGVRLNVNRPTEGASLAATAEVATPRAAAVHALYLERVRAVAAGPLAVYCEVHGNSRPGTAGRVEIATAGIDASAARRLATLVGAAAAALAARCGSELVVCVEPLDRLQLTASAARCWPPFAEAGRVLHVELPQMARRRTALAATVALVSALLGAVESSI